MNRYGERFCVSTFGESHGKAIGCIVDGFPAGVVIDEAFIQGELNRRRPGQSKFTTARSEADTVEILSGTFGGQTTGMPIAMVIFNTDQKSKDYSHIKDVFRPGHADFTYFSKYGIRDYRGGGRSSARESAARVAAGALAKLVLKQLGISVKSGIESVHGIAAQSFDYAHALQSEINALDPNVEEAQKDAILKAKEAHDSVGGVVRLVCENVPVGLGEPLYNKADALFAEYMMGINAVKAVEVGEGIKSTEYYGSQNNDQMNAEGFMSNHAGGILGGMTNGEPVTLRIHFKPTPSIFQKQTTQTTEHEGIDFELKGRHDPCVAIRGAVVCEAMAACALLDLLLLNMGATLQGIQKYYA